MPVRLDTGNNPQEYLLAKDTYQIWLEARRHRLAVAVDLAEPLVRDGEYDAAESLVREVDGDIYGAMALGALFTRALQQRVQEPAADAEHVRALFERALRWRSAWPEPHTRDEAEAASSHHASVRAELLEILASTPPGR